jgi:hypothetical protein
MEYTNLKIDFNNVVRVNSDKSWEFYQKVAVVEPQQICNIPSMIY